MTIHTDMTWQLFQTIYELKLGRKCIYYDQIRKLANKMEMLC